MSSDESLIRVHRGDHLPDGLHSPDVYFLPGYGRAAGIVDRAEWVLLEAFGGAWQVPLILRTLDDGAKDAISPYGYTGVYASPSLSSSQVREAWSATIDCLEKLSIISVLLRHSPLVPQAPGLPGLISIISGHPTIVLEPADSDSAWSGMECSCRNQIRKALKNGYTGEVRQVVAQDLAAGGAFRRLYEETMRRRTAESRHFFGDRYYRGLLDGLGSNLIIAEVRDREGVTVSSTLLMQHGQRLHYHLTGSDPMDARMGSNNLMLWTATQFAVEHGIRQFHLGGGVNPGDGLFRFKRTFGGRELEYRVSGLIIDAERYQARAQRRDMACAVPTDTTVTRQFFPAYRERTP
jgi:Acetyltransferase (GNAT) domain